MLLQSPAGFLLSVFHLLLTPHLSLQWRPKLIHEYPEQNNFSFVRLTCTKDDDDFRTPLESATFTWNNNTDVEDAEEMGAERDGAGSVTVILEQEYEGVFTCLSNGTHSDGVSLAAQPVSVENVTVVYIPVNGPDDVIMVPLRCGIQPGLMVNSYRVTWRKFYSDNIAVILSTEQFNITVNVSLRNDSNTVMYSCEVQVSHDARRSRTYPGGMFQIVVTGPGSQHNINTRSGVFLVVLASAFALLCMVLTLIPTMHILNRKRKHRATKCATTKSSPTGSVSNCMASRGLSGAVCELSTHEQEYAPREQGLEIGYGEEIERPVGQQISVQFELTSDDDDNDSDSVRVVSSMYVSDDVSFSPNLYDDKKCTSSPCFDYFLEPSSQSAAQSRPSHSKSYAVLETCSPPPMSESALYRSMERDESCRNVWDTECINPHCPCHGLRMQTLLKTDISPQTTNPLTMCSKSSKSVFPDFVDRKYVLHDCTEKGLMHADKEYGLVIEIPEGAVPGGMRLTLDVALRLYGPFHYPRKSRRISPIVWVCVRDFENFRFLKPVKISLQHCLKIQKSDDLETLGVRFLKAGHSCDESGLFSFQETDGVVEPGASEDYLTFSTTHFCYMCLVSNEKLDTLERIKYCLTPYHPQPVFKKDNDKIHFYVSFFLNACLVTINKQCGSGLKKLPPRGFYFTRDSKCLGIQFEEPENWILALESNEEITAEDIDFQRKDPKELLMEEKERMYPPKFTIRAHSLPGALPAKVRFNFSGGEKKMALDILLLTEAHRGQAAARVTQLEVEPPEQQRQRSSSPSVSRSPSPMPSPMRLQDPVVPLHFFMEHVAVHARTKWRFFGIMIDIPPDTLDSFPGHDCLQAFSRVFEFWVRRASRLQKTTPPVTWETVASVLESDTVDEKKLGDDIRRNFVPCVLPQPRVMDRSASTYSQQTRSTADTGYESQPSRSDSTPVMVSDV